MYKLCNFKTWKMYVYCILTINIKCIIWSFLFYKLLKNIPLWPLWAPSWHLYVRGKWWISNPREREDVNTFSNHQMCPTKENKWLWTLLKCHKRPKSNPREAQHIVMYVFWCFSLFLGTRFGIQKACTWKRNDKCQFMAA